MTKNYLTPAQVRYFNNCLYCRPIKPLKNGYIVFRHVSCRSSFVMTPGAYVLTGKQYLEVLKTSY